MIKNISIFLLLVVFAVEAKAKCRPVDGKPIVIGCSYKCSFVYRFRLLITALSLGYPLQIVDMREWNDPSTAMKVVDGILMPGGADIDPEFYLPYVTAELQQYTRENIRLVEFSEEGKFRDGFEHELVKRYSSEKDFEQLPLLGICRGMQMMGVAQGIPLYLDLKHELGIRNRRNVFDRIHLDQEKNDSLISTLFNREEVRGFKLHHQGIRVPYYLKHQHKYPLTRISAYSHDGKIAEALEYIHRPALGVQYHPEKSFTAASLPLFRWLFTKACEYKNSHKERL